MATATAPGLPEIERARERLEGVARVTPVFPSGTLSRLAGRPVRLKAENLQRTGSFKIRGAYTKLSNLEPEELAGGVVAASAGNHGQAVAWAARELGAPARIFMPHYSPMAKFEATRSYGAEVEMSGAVWEETLEAAVAYVEQTGATLVVEGAGAAGVAAILGGLAGGSGPVLALLSGGNIDASLMVQVMRRGLAIHGRYLVLRTRVIDRPGELATLLDLLAAERVNVVEVEHQREAAGVPVGYTGVELTLLTRDPEHCDLLLGQMREWGYPVERLD